MPSYELHIVCHFVRCPVLYRMMLLFLCIMFIFLYILLQRSEGGLFVDMNSFLAFGKEFVAWNYEKSGNPVYLHIIETQKPVSEDRPSKKPTLLAIGTE